MRVDAFDYELPPELIAQHPAADREAARLMHVPGSNAKPRHLHIANLPDLFAPGALVVVNDTRVIPARLLGRKRETGGKAEILLVRRVGECDLEVGPGDIRKADVWNALGKTTKPMKVGADIEVTPRNGVVGIATLAARLLSRSNGEGLLQVALWSPARMPLDAALLACGHVPLPPYIGRDAEPDDAVRYQTVFARHDGAIAAPTAGLHFTPAILDRLASRGCEVVTITLHVGPGTFLPVTVDNLDAHPMHAETYAVSQSTADAIARARGRGAPVIAIGTTTVRALESSADPERTGFVRAGGGETKLLVQPGFAWRVVDGLLTNFHLPRSTLLALVCAFSGTDEVLAAYRLAVKERYRFFSYGDAMLLWRRL